MLKVEAEGEDPRVYDAHGKVVGIKAGPPPEWEEVIGKLPTMKMTLKEEPNITMQVGFILLKYFDTKNLLTKFILNKSNTRLWMLLGTTTNQTS